MRIPYALPALVAGLVLPFYLAELPDWRWPLCAALALWLAGRLLPGWRGVFGVALLSLLGVAWTSWRAEQVEQLSPAWEGKPVAVVAVVRDLPDPGEFGTRLRVEVEQVLTPGATLPRSWLLTDYRNEDWPPGSRWRLTLAPKQPTGPANRFGFDAEAWYWSEGIGATASVRKGRIADGEVDDARARLDRIRSTLLERIDAAVAEPRAAALLGALTVGAQGRIAAADWQAFRLLGLTHLVSISGLHVTLFAGLVAALLRLVLRWRPPRRIAPRLVVALGGLAAALGYALLAGWSVPTQRTFYMLACAVLMLLLRRSLGPFRIWWSALALVLLADPFAVLAPGVWLSFGLVVALMAVGVGRRRRAGRWQEALLGQWAVLVMSLLPLALFFNGVPLVSPFANAVAIPYVSSLLTPLALFAVFIPWDGPLRLAGWLADGFYWAVDLAAPYAPMWSQPGVPWPVAALAFVGSLWLIAPRGVPGRLAGALLLLPLLLYRPPPPAPGTLRATLIDVGQGLSVLVETANHTLLYDTGAGDAGRTVLPQLTGLGVKRLDVLLLSHHDNDHDGGGESLLAAMPVDTLLAGQPESLPDAQPAAQACLSNQSWAWDGVRFDMLAPDEGVSITEDNAASCVLRIATQRQALLLPGDLPGQQEQALAERYGKALRSSVLVASHHGSRYSSGADWLATVAPREVVFSAGYRNRYRHPHPDTLARVAGSGARAWRTDTQGMLTLEMGETLTLKGWREQAPRFWRRRPVVSDEAETVE
ncbi:DNA internalization-related competence protein ComEC/Rec2 [Crenobacter sp. SG2303]|uniref:DNA internalization-related competence protein ComEC/Rec2 n=1 Tax=Crenobacter oryzisoli TaxID=3056844 RepID=A0ABT7XSI8_9NEIS|nr:DNA internalization-related competence protein ComEC/Rec2 [Crenobacter sp. SG2303]MDN0076755.1 DNA internalization-related competence protein ComEC/Rec2 [Crenobacter sp. SG2303]